MLSCPIHAFDLFVPSSNFLPSFSTFQKQQPRSTTKMDYLGSSIPGVSMYQQRPNINATSMARPRADAVDLTGDDVDDSGSEEEDEDEVPDTSSAALPMSLAPQDSDNDTLDVSKLNYAFKMLRKNSTTKPLDRQFITIRSFLGKLDKKNHHHTFTPPQYRRAWEHAVQLQENRVAVNQIVQARPGLDAAGIEAEFMAQMKRVSRSVSECETLDSMSDDNGDRFIWSSSRRKLAVLRTTTPS
jgi:hypothetical protein